MQKLLHRLSRLALIGLVFPVQFCLAQVPLQENVYFAGPAFISNYADIPQRFPLVSQAIGFGAGSASGEFEALLRNEVRTIKPRAFQIANKDEAVTGDYKKGTGKAVSFAFSHESVEVQEMDDKFVTVYDIAAQVLFFDYSPEARRLLASYPVRLRYTDLTTARPTIEQQRATVKARLFDTQQQTSLIKHWMRRMETAEPKGGDRLVNVKQVEFDPKAAGQIPADVSREMLSVEIAQMLESTISEEWQVPMVPVTVGEAVKGKMVQVLSNGDSAEFDLPPPSHVVRTLVRDFRKVSEPINGGERVAYGVFITSSIVGAAGPLSELKIKNVESITRPKIIKVQLNDWAQFRNTLASLLVKATQQVLASDRAWIAENSATPSAKQQLDLIKSRVLGR
jgi:hypothetical protein